MDEPIVKRLLFTCAITAAIGLAACSGGGGGGTGGGTPPTLAPTATPLAYAPKIVWSGAMHYSTGTGAGSFIPASIDSSSGAILMVAGDSTDPTAEGSDPRGATVTAQVSPQPTAYPETTFTTTGITAIATIAPTPTPGPSASPQPPTILLEPGQDNASGAGTVTATIAAPVAAATTAPAIVYPLLTLNCGRAVPTGEHIFGVQWDGSQWVDDPDPTTADLYLGTNNAGCFPSDPSTGNTLYYPGGGVILDSTNAFDLVATTDWSNAGTSVDIGLVANVMDKTLIFKTRGGIYAKYHAVSYSGDPDLSGAIEVHGQGLDSF